MIIHPPLSVLFVVADEDSSLQPFLSHLESFHHIQLTTQSHLPQDLGHYDVVVTTHTADHGDDLEPLEQFVKAGGGWLGLVSLSRKPLPQLFGAQPGPLGPAAELRVLFQDAEHPMAQRMSDAFYMKGRYQALEKTAEDAEIILYADWHYQHKPVLVNRPVGEGQVSCTTLQACDDPAFQQILYRLLRQSAGQPIRNQILGVGLLGYSPFIGREHGSGVEATDGLSLHAVCDLNPQQLNQAQQDFPNVKTYESADALAEDAETDVVIVCTPPNTHARLSMQMMAAGKHVLCEKPLAMNRKESAAMVDLAEEQRVHLSCHQNRRWDVDYLAIKQALADGLIGDLFYMETFVGGFSHPCGYWHSHDEISGGIAYDWGGHYLDWVVSLIPDPPGAVIATRHKRVWHDVTNADQERIHIRFAGGQEAEFLHSDVAAVRKPKWYLLGTEGAIVGHWRDVTEYEIDSVLYFRQHEIPATEMIPDLTLHHRHPSGQIVMQKLAMPERQPYLLYRNLADHLLTGEPIVAPLEQSVLVVAILEAAANSATRGGTTETLNV
jgi:predicted dehydrogenase